MQQGCAHFLFASGSITLNRMSLQASLKLLSKSLLILEIDLKKKGIFKSKFFVLGDLYVDEGQTIFPRESQIAYPFMYNCTA